MSNSATNTALNMRTRLALWSTGLLRGGLDPQKAEPRLFRQVKVLNGLMLTGLLMCIPFGLFWMQVFDSKFGYVYATTFLAWAGLLSLLRRTHKIVFVGRAAVCVLFALCAASVLLLGGVQSKLLSWFMMMPLAAAVCVGRHDLWFWGVVATLTPLILHQFPHWSPFGTSPFSPATGHLVEGIALALGAFVVSVLTGIWIAHHERLAQRLDDSVERLKKEVDAHRLLVDTTMLASAETELSSGAHKLLEHLDQVDWVSSVCFWDTRGCSEPREPFYKLPICSSFEPTPLLARCIRTGQRSVSKPTELGRFSYYYPIQDGQDVVGVVEVNTGALHDSEHEGSWLIQQVAIQLGHIAERERTAQIIQHEARYDALTNLNNRRSFHDILEREIEVAERDRKQVALLFIDLNDFKRVNDSLGHAAGDAVLKVVATRLRQAIRHSDSQDDDFGRASDAISRVGGDEFTLVLKDISSSDGAELAAQRILDSLASPIQLDGQQFKVGASIGIAVYPDDAQQADVLVRSADAAMYAAKRRGGLGYSRYRDADKAVDSLSFEAEIRRALDEGQFEMHYQPVFSCETSAAVGAEALIRWQHPERGWVSPAQFIPLAESIGLIGEIGKFQFDTVLHWFAQSRAELPDDFRVALNLSPAQVEDPHFVDWLLGRLANSNLPMRNLELEITETALLADTAEIQANIRALDQLGLCITLDDFGTGQSSLSLLKRFPIGRIKIDRSFVSGLPNRSEDVAIVGAVLSLAHSLEIPAVAEGVEEEEQRLFLTSRECDDMQGYLLARPMPGEQLTQKLREASFDFQTSEEPFTSKVG